MKYLIDTSAIIEKAITKLIAKGKLKGKILIPRAAVSELEYQANAGQEIGTLGLEELQALQELSQAGKIEIEFVGERPRSNQMGYEDFNIEIDLSISELAYNEGATLVTADKIQAKTARAYGIPVEFYTTEAETPELEIEKYFDETTMSLHIKENTTAKAKRGSPG